MIAYVSYERSFLVKPKTCREQVSARGQCWTKEYYIPWIDFQANMRKCFEFLFSLTFSFLSFFFPLIDVATHLQSTTEQERAPQRTADTAQTHTALSLQPARIITNGLFYFLFFYFSSYTFLYPPCPAVRIFFQFYHIHPVDLHFRAILFAWNGEFQRCNFPPEKCRTRFIQKRVW